MSDAVSSLPAADVLEHLHTLLEQHGGASSRDGFASVARAPRSSDSVSSDSISSGIHALDQFLPDRGFRPGALVEWLAATPGSGASFLALAAVRQMQRRTEAVAAVIDRQRNFYPPAAAAWGIDLANVIVIRPQTPAEELWALDQALRSTRLSAVVAWPEQIDSHTFRRLQLAAEESGVLGLLVRPDAVRREPSWAHLRLLVSTQMSSDSAWRQEVRLLRCRGGFGRGNVELRIDHQTGEIA